METELIPWHDELEMPEDSSRHSKDFGEEGSSANEAVSHPSLCVTVTSDSPAYVCPDPILRGNGTEVSIENAVDLHKGVTEIKFNGVFGRKDSKRYCKLKCINGEWVGPLCLSDGGNQSTVMKPITFLVGLDLFFCKKNYEIFFHWSSYVEQSMLLGEIQL